MLLMEVLETLLHLTKNDATKLPGFANSVSFLGKNFTEDKKADRYTVNLLFSYEKQKRCRCYYSIWSFSRLW